jgi:hypothetical protein
MLEISALIKFCKHRVKDTLFFPQIVQFKTNCMVKIDTLKLALHTCSPRFFGPKKKRGSKCVELILIRLTPKLIVGPFSYIP